MLKQFSVSYNESARASLPSPSQLEVSLGADDLRAGFRERSPARHQARTLSARPGEVAHETHANTIPVVFAVPQWIPHEATGVPGPDLEVGRQGRRLLAVVQVGSIAVK